MGSFLAVCPGQHENYYITLTACELTDFFSFVAQQYLRTSEYQVPACVARRTLDMLFPILANFRSQWLHDCEIVEQAANFPIPWCAGSSNLAGLHMRIGISVASRNESRYTIVYKHSLLQVGRGHPRREQLRSILPGANLKQTLLPL